MDINTLKVRRGLRLRTMTEINVINLVDVMLTLLIIFILVAPAIKEGIPLTLPEATQVKEIKRESIVVEMDAKGKLALSNRYITKESLLATLEEYHDKNPDDGVMLKADESVAYGEVVKVFDLIRTSGIERVGILTRKVSDREIR